MQKVKITKFSAAPSRELALRLKQEGDDTMSAENTKAIQAIVGQARSTLSRLHQEAQVKRKISGHASSTEISSTRVNFKKLLSGIQADLVKVRNPASHSLCYACIIERHAGSNSGTGS